MSGERGWKAIYNGLMLPLAYAIVRAAAPFHHKLRETIEGRDGVEERWRASAGRITARPVWFHVASVGEYEQARPLISMLRESHPGIPVAISMTSPSGYKYITRKETLDERNNVKFVDYMPFDFEDNVRFCLASLDPRLLVFVKFDLWPNLVWERGGEKGPGRPHRRHALRDVETLYRVSDGVSTRAVYPAIDKILAISEADARRFRSSACRITRAISVAGDTRFDRVMERKRNRAAANPRIDKNEPPHRDGGEHLAQGRGAPPRAARAAGPNAERGVLLVIAPHEPSPARVEALLAWARSEIARGGPSERALAGDAGGGRRASRASSIPSVSSRSSTNTATSRTSEGASRRESTT